MDFWGFIILDGRRIGYDLKLYKEIGSSKIPYDRREMKTELGDDNFFTTSQSEYKKAVNQYIFGFRKAEQYEQFIKLLVKVRAPKLSIQPDHLIPIADLPDVFRQFCAGTRIFSHMFTPL